MVEEKEEKKNEICSLDIDTRQEEHVFISKAIGTPKVYRNGSTRALDETYKGMLSPSQPFTPIPDGSSFPEGQALLPIFADLANITRFYFGVSIDRLRKPSREKGVISDHDKKLGDYIQVCVARGTLEIVEYRDKDKDEDKDKNKNKGLILVFPKRFV